MKNDEIKDIKICELFKKCKLECNVKKNIKLCTSQKINIPSIYGVWNIKIFIPEELIYIDEIKLKNIIKHEIYHFKRKDNVLNYIIIFLKSIYWFNPLVGILLNTVKENMEYATDELVIKEMSKNEYKDYCKTILGVSTQNYELLEYALGFISKKEELEKRVDNILGKEYYYHNQSIKKFLSVVVCFCLILFLSPIEKYCYKDQVYIKTSSKDEICILSSKDVNENIININLGEYIMFVNNKRNIRFMNLSNKDGTIENWSVIAYTEKGVYSYEIKNETTNDNYYLKVIVE